MPSGRNLTTVFRVNLETRYINTSDQLNPNNVRDNLRYFEIAKKLANGIGLNKANLQHYSRRRLINSTEIINLDTSLTNRWGDALNFDEIKLGVIYNRQEEENRFLEVNIKDEKYYIGPEGYRIFWEPSDIGLVDASSSEKVVGNLVISSNADIEYDLILIGSGNEGLVGVPTLHLSGDTGVETAASVPATNGQTVLNWIDTIASKIFTQSTEANKPILRTNGIGGEPALDFDGSDDILILAESFFTGTTGTIFIVFKADTISPDDIFSSSDEALTTKNLKLGVAGTNTLKIIQVNADTADQLTDDSSLVVDTPYIATFSSDGSTYATKLNGIQTTLTPLTGSNSGDWYGDTPDRDNVTIGATKHTSEIAHFDGLIAEIIVYDGIILEAEEINDNETFLANKYGIALGS